MSDVGFSPVKPVGRFKERSDGTGEDRVLGNFSVGGEGYATPAPAFGLEPAYL
jgi:hypothetical protein